MKLRKGTPVRWSGHREVYTFVRRGIPGIPTSRKWMTILDESGLEQHAAITDLYEDGPEWHEWQRVYDEQQAETKAAHTCPTCGQWDMQRTTDDDTLTIHAVRLSRAHDAAVRAAGRQTFSDRYGRPLYGEARERRYDELLAQGKVPV